MGKICGVSFFNQTKKRSGYPERFSLIVHHAASSADGNV
jgi:hypothetical protein